MADSIIPLHFRSGREKVGEWGGREGGREACQQAGFLIANFLSHTLQLY